MMLKKDAIKHFGSQKKLADFLGVTQPAVAVWPDKVPEGYAAILHQRTRGRLKYRIEDYH